MNYTRPHRIGLMAEYSVSKIYILVQLSPERARELEAGRPKFRELFLQRTRLSTIETSDLLNEKIAIIATLVCSCRSGESSVRQWHRDL